MSKGAFRGWVAASVVLMIAWLVADFVTARQLPDELRAFHDAEPEMTPGFLAVVFAALALMVIYFIAVAGLLLFWRPARVLYLISSVGGCVILFFMGPTVSTAFTNGLAYLDSVVSGFILALLYYSPIKQHFDTPESIVP